VIEDPYNERVRALFAMPAHAGTLADAPQVIVEDQGVRIEFSALVKAGRIERLRFRALGCPHVIAAAEWVCAKYEGGPGGELESFGNAELMKTLAVPIVKSGRILVLEDAVRALGAAIRETSAIN
jgi:NifU-like protein involved in Fe-S cluster formation